MKIYKFIDDSPYSNVAFKYAIIDNNILDIISFLRIDANTIEMLVCVHDDNIKQSYDIYKLTKFMQYYENSVYDERYIEKSKILNHESMTLCDIFIELGYSYKIEPSSKEEHDLIVEELKNIDHLIHIDHRDYKFSNIALKNLPPDSLSVILELTGIKHESL